MDQIPIWLTVNDRGVLVAGGGGVAAAKARIATNAGAMVTVVAPSLGPEIQALVNAGVARHVARKFEAGDVDGQALVFGATGIEQVDAAVAAAAHTVNVPVNIPDHPDLSDFIMPAIVDRGPVVVGISTGGAAPALARQIRGKIESILPARLGDLALLAKDFRQTVKAKIPRGLARLRFWDGLFDGPVADAVLAGDERSAQRHFLRSLNAGDAQSDPAGSVHVVGAGPGDPELLTLRALRLIQTADVVVYDRLVSPEILDFARRDAERINVGKAPGNHAMAQDQINQVLVSQAKLGMRVVRLKGGDPFVFGRGGEEVDFIQSHGIDTSVVPGITAALACAAAAGIPLTHRQSSSAVTFLTGHGADGGDTEERDGVLRDVRAIDSEDVALAKAPRRQSSGGPPDGADQLSIRQRASTRTVDEGRFIGVFRRMFEQEVLERHVWNVHVRIGAAIDHRHLRGSCPATPGSVCAVQGMPSAFAKATAGHVRCRQGYGGTRPLSPRLRGDRSAWV